MFICCLSLLLSFPVCFLSFGIPCSLCSLSFCLCKNSYQYINMLSPSLYFFLFLLIYIDKTGCFSFAPTISPTWLIVLGSRVCKFAGKAVLCVCLCALPSPLEYRNYKHKGLPVFQHYPHKSKHGGTHTYLSKVNNGILGPGNTQHLNRYLRRPIVKF